MWHSSVAPADGRKPHERQLRVLALVCLAGVGDKGLGEWHEWSGRAYHVRRRLTPAEEAGVGPAVDCRGTAEGENRLAALLPAVSPALRRRLEAFALEETGR